MSNPRPLRIGIVGLGFMAATHLKALKHLTQDWEVVAVCNPSGRHLDGDFSQVAGNIGTADPLKLDMSKVAAYRDFSEFLAHPGLEVVDICAPTLLHADLAVAALKAGKDVLCEKPMARTSADAQRMVDAAAASGRLLMPAMCIRFWPEWKWVRDQVKAGTYGKVLSARFRRVTEPPGWGHQHFGDGAKSGGGLLDLHIHDTDFVQYCFGKPKTVFSSGHAAFTGAVDYVVTQYVVEGGAVVHAEGTWALAKGAGFTMEFTVNFERATVDYDFARTDARLRVSQDGEQKTITVEGIDGYVGEFAHLAARLRGVADTVLVTAEDGASAVRICEAEERSVYSGRPETVA